MTRGSPKEVIKNITNDLWRRADSLSWAKLSDAERSNYYEQWTKESAIGGLLAEFIDPRGVRVYIKDTLMKPYLRDRLDRMAPTILETFGFSGSQTTASFVKPHGRKIDQVGIVCWGNSRDWKAIVMSAFERVNDLDPGARGFVALLESGNTADPRSRALVRLAASRLELESPLWLDTAKL